MAPAMQLFMLVALAVSSLAAPATSKTLAKRTFKLAAAGRGKLDPVRENIRVHRKYGWTISVLPSEIEQAAVDDSAASRAPPAPFSTADSVSTLAAYGADSTLTSVPTSTRRPVPSYGNSSGRPSTTKSSEDGEVTAKPEPNESEYLAAVTIGGDQKLNLNFDTGSADLWVFSTKQSKSEIGRHAVFDPSKSDTWQALPNATWSIQYADFSGANGSVGYDTVDVGGSFVEKQCVELAEHVSQQFVEDANSDGLLGLGFKTISTVKPAQQNTFFENVMDQLSLPVFTADLEDENGVGTYEFGVIDDSSYTGEIHYTSVNNSRGWWAINTPKFSIGGKERLCPKCRPAIADTGTSLIYLESEIVKEYYSEVRAAQVSYRIGGLWTYPCSETLPNLGIMIGDFAATINGTDMKYMKEPDTNGQRCIGGLQATDDVQVIGDVFFKQYFAVFHGGTMEFGVAEKRRPGTAA